MIVYNSMETSDYYSHIGILIDTIKTGFNMNKNNYNLIILIIIKTDFL